METDGDQNSGVANGNTASGGNSRPTQIAQMSLYERQAVQALQALQRQPNAAQYFQQLMLQQHISSAQLHSFAAVQQATLTASRQASSPNASFAQLTSTSQATMNLTTSSGGGALLTSRATGPAPSTQASALNQSVLLGSAGAGQGQMYLRVNRSLRTPLSSQFILMSGGAAAMATVQQQQQQQQQQEVPATNTSGHPDINQVQKQALRCPPSSAVLSVSAAPGPAQRTTLPKTEGAGQGEKKAGEAESGGGGVGINLTRNISNSQATLITTAPYSLLQQQFTSHQQQKSNPSQQQLLMHHQQQSASSLATHHTNQQQHQQANSAATAMQQTHHCTASSANATSNNSHCLASLANTSAHQQQHPSSSQSSRQMVLHTSTLSYQPRAITSVTNTAQILHTSVAVGLSQSTQSIGGAQTLVVQPLPPQNQTYENRLSVTRHSNLTPVPIQPKTSSQTVTAATQLKIPVPGSHCHTQFPVKHPPPILPAPPSHAPHIPVQLVGARQPGQVSAQALGLTQVIAVSSAQSCNSNSSTMGHIHNVQHSGVAQQHVHVKPLSGAVHDNSQANQHQQGGGGGGGGGGEKVQPVGSGNVGVSAATTSFGNVGMGFSSLVTTAAVLPQQLQLPHQQSLQQHQQKQQPKIVRPCSGAICGSVLGPGSISGASAATQTSATDVSAKTGAAAASGVYVQPLQLQVKQPVGGIKRKAEAGEQNEKKRESPPSLHPSLEGPYQKPDNTPEKNQASDLTPLVPSLSSPLTASRGVASDPSLLSSGHHGNDSKPPQAIVKPQVLTHLIEGFVIQEGAEPFPVGGPVKDRQEGVSSLLAFSPSSLPDHYYQNTVSNGKSSLLKCEYCGNLELALQFRGSKRFCSMTCAKRYNVSCIHQFRPKHKKVKGARLGDGGGVRMRRRGPHRSSSEIPCSKITVRNLDNKTRSDSSQGSGENSSYEDEAPSPNLSPSCSQPSHSEQAAHDSSGSAPAELPLHGEPHFLSENPAHWSMEEVCEFISSLHGCQEVATEFLAQKIDGQALLLLKEEHLMTAMNIKLGPALKICAHINMLKEG
ncbi:polyhomeotic-like protein 1 isoform X2 [Polyodon spathula]|uniref:polyhomeotic-like protein 1 isoform X2 n=1 Tax=Polyodon spathula TaxID=7913 RepID=UPI001B7D9688|nr:polyhomeotic-like protein 1 isoform X2 [Polyodon spathula]